MKEIVNFFDELPWIVKIILSIPAFDGLCWGIYRICKGHLIAGIIWIFLGFTLIGSAFDIYTLIKDKKITFFAN